MPFWGCALHRWLPRYWRLPLTQFWLAMWSAPVGGSGWKKTWKALRITIRKGECHSEIIKVLKKGII